MSLLVASIDLGTTFSGWAYSYKHDYETNRNSIHTKNWQASSHISQKAPTVVLIKPDGKTLHSFGYDAESKYADLAETGDHKDWYFFRRFKMLLFDKKGMQVNTLIEEAGGKKLEAIEVFYLTIKCIKDDLIATIKQQLSGEEFRVSDVSWVVTVPAIWNDAAKQFMRCAAEKAGIDKDKLILALEPEAASLHCRHLPVDKNVGDSDASLCKYPIGTKYIVVDAGGGTVDITVHEIVSENAVRELHKASGGAWGGTKVDDAFEQLIEDILGTGTFDDMRRESMEEYLDISRDIEMKKREVDPDSDRAVSIRIPSILHQFTMTRHKKTLGEIVAESHHHGQVSVSRDKFRLDKDIALSLFDYATKSIISHLRKLLSMPSISDCTAILMVGGFSESRVLQQSIRNAFSTLQVIIPQDAGLAVMKGAVNFGFSPMYIEERIAKYTYGTSYAHAQTESCVHPPAPLYTLSDGITICVGLFKVLVKEGSTLKLDSITTQSCRPKTQDQTVASLQLFVSEYPNAVLITDPGCRKIGQLNVPIDPKQFKLGTIHYASFLFGGTEIVVTVNNTFTGEKFSTSVDFLG